MPLNRRDVLKTLLMSPFFGVAGKLHASAMSGFTPGTLNIILNGLFFMELDKSDAMNPKLVIHAPRVTDHNFLVGTRGNLQPSSGFNWSSVIGLTGGPVSFNRSPDIPDQVPASVLQFTKKETGFSAFMPDSNALYVGKVILPWPKQIVPLRPDNFPPFDAGTAQNPRNVAPKITARCGTSQIGVVTCLQYDYAFPNPVLPPTGPVTNVHLHMVCCKDSDSTTDHINKALTDAASIFQPDSSHPGAFDLQLKPTTVVGSPFEPQRPLPGVPLEDERAAIEDGACRGMAGAPTEKNAQRKNKKITGAENTQFENVAPANCPAFFVG